jgi:SAM-dependent methyltransferase
VTLQTPTIEETAADGAAPGVAGRKVARLHVLVLAAIAFVPLLRSHPGWIAADTKAYLYLDPTKLLRSAMYLWNPNVGSGTVTHQNIGYLFPMGPWYWVFHEAHVPTWIAQRLWMGTLIFAAGMGVRYLARLLGVAAWGQLAAALCYMLTPYIIDYLARTSAILMPWAGLGWLVGFAIVAVRRGGWRYPALFALVVALIGGVNATSVLLVGLAPALWLLLAGITKEASWRRVLAATLRTGVLSAVVSAWWVAGLWAEGAFGINVLRYTETFPTVTLTSLSSEVLRGLGYWYFYGNDAIQPWTQTSSTYMSHGLGVLLSFAVPAVALLGAAFIRWRYRAFAVLLVVMGVVLAVGAYPLSDPSPLGRVFRSIGESSTIGLAMRSSNRVLPIVVLGLSLLAGAAVSSLRAWRPSVSMLAGVLIGALACFNLAPFFEGNVVATNLMFPETLPKYVTNAANYLNASGRTPVLGLPGADFGYYHWGVTLDSVWPGLLDRPYIQRQAVLQGEPASANLLRALDESIQNGVFDPATLVPMARLMGVGAVLLQSDLQYERFDLPRPQALWLELHPTPAGMALTKSFGTAHLDRTQVGRILDETQLGIPTNASYPPALAVFRIAQPRALLRTESRQDPIVLDGDGDGVLLAAGAGLLNGSPRAIVYAASQPAASLARLAQSHGTLLVVTDSNAKELDTWGTLHTTYGAVEQAGAEPLSFNPAEQSLPIFTNQSPSTQTVLVVHGIRSVGASGYGNAVANAPEDQPLNAVDGNALTAWAVGAFTDPRGQFLRINLVRPTTVSSLFLQQPQVGIRTRWASRVRLTFSDGSTQVLRLGTDTRTSGATFHFPAHRTTSLTITITAMTGSQTVFTGASPVGFAQVRIPGVGPVTSTLQLPTDLLSGAGSAGNHDSLVILLHRLRAATIPPRTDPELSMSRTFDLPSARTFSITGTARVSDLVDDARLDTLLGRGTGRKLHVVSTDSSSRLTGSIANDSWAAFDGNHDTSWSPAYVGPVPVWLSATLSHAVSINHVTLHVVLDGRHSVPRVLEVTTDRGTRVEAPIRYDPASRVGSGQGATESATAKFAPIAGTTFKFAFPSNHAIVTTDHISGLPTVLPIGIADVMIPNAANATTPGKLASACRAGLLSIDGKDVAIRITGTTRDALAQRALSITACGSPRRLGSGSHVLTTAPGYATGWNLDTLELRSGATTPAVAPSATAHVTHVAWANDVSLHATVGPQSRASWLVLNQSFSLGWHASIKGRDLGAPVLLDGGFMAWRLPASTTSATVSISWKPQSTVDIALAVSALGLVVVLGLIVIPRRRRSQARSLAARQVPNDLEPVLAWPWRSRTMSLPLCAAATVLSVLIAGPAVAVILVPLLALAWWRRPLRAVLALAPALVIALAGAYMIYEQRKYDWPHNIQWPTHFGTANTLGWIAVCILVVDVLGFREDADPWFAIANLSRAAGGPDPSAPQGLARIVPTRLVGLISVVAPSRLAPPAELGRTGESLIALPASGIPRSVALFRAFRKEQSDPDYFYRMIALDTLVRLTGSTPLFNRTVIDIGGGAGYFAEAFRNAGARVVLIEPEADAPLPPHLQGPEQSLDLHARHERAVWPGRLMAGDTIAGDGLSLPLPDNFADLVFSSNVLEHVPDPSKFIDESVRVARSGGQIYLSFTVWWSPWGGHETSPWHYLSGRYAKRRYTKRHGHPPKNVYGESLFALKVSTVLKLLAARDDVALIAAEPRYLPRWAAFLVKVPVLREVVTWNLVTLLEKL